MCGMGYWDKTGSDDGNVGSVLLGMLNALACRGPDSAGVASVEAASGDVAVVSVGRRLEIVTPVGSPSRLEQTFGISKFHGAHGIGHTRLSTESLVDLSHSQPFWAHGYSDLAMIHNGHIDNYHQLRRPATPRNI